MKLKTVRSEHFLKLLSIVTIAASTSLVSTTHAQAASCWNHNGSVMRLEASGNQRWFYYQNPKQVLRNAGVRPGTLFFNGRKNGNFYSGTARRFSRFCPGQPLTYYVEGPVASNQLRVTLRGQYEVNRRCQPTGRVKNDRLVFTYMYQC